MSGVLFSRNTQARDFGSAWHGMKRSRFDMQGPPIDAAPPGNAFGGLTGTTITKGKNNTSTLQHARQPVNQTYLVDLDQSNLPTKYKRGSRSRNIPDRMSYNEKNKIAQGEINKEDICCIRRISSHKDGLSYAVKSVAGMNMYLRSDEGMKMYGTERHHGKLTDDWSLACMSQVSKVFPKTFSTYTAYSIVYSVSGVCSVRNAWLACQLQPHHQFTKKTINEGDYVGYVLQRFRYHEKGDQAAELMTNYDDEYQRKSKQSRTSDAIDISGAFSNANEKDTRIVQWKHEDLYRKYDLMEISEEQRKDVRHYWQLVPYVSNFADGPHLEYYWNQHFTGRLFPCGMVMESYAPDINPKRWHAEHGLYYTFPWRETEDKGGDMYSTGGDSGWRERYLEHRTKLGSLTIIQGLNRTKLYMV